MIDIFQNPFSNTDIKLTRPTVVASSQAKSGAKSSLQNIKDEYLPSTSSSSDTPDMSKMRDSKPIPDTF